MAVNNVPAATGANGTSDTQKRVPTQDLGKNEFMQILAMQLSNQDPLEPMKDTDFIAQMAQFSSLEEMQALNNSFSSNKAYGMIGKNVLANVRDTDGLNASIYGEVVGVVRQGTTDYLQVGEYLVPMTAVQSVYDDNAMDAIVSQAANLVGKEIEAEMPGEAKPGDTEPPKPEKISGVVESVIIKNGLLYAVIEDKEVPVAYINKVK